MATQLTAISGKHSSAIVGAIHRDIYELNADSGEHSSAIVEAIPFDADSITKCSSAASTTAGDCGRFADRLRVGPMDTRIQPIIEIIDCRPGTENQLFVSQETQYRRGFLEARFRQLQLC